MPLNRSIAYYSALSVEDRQNIILWTNEWFATNAICQNECGCNSKQLCRKIAKVYVLQKNILQADGILTDEQLDNLYRRLQCLINLFVSV